MDSTRKRKRVTVSKNKKKSWRKNTDINDVEEHLDDIRLQERTGGVVSEKTDENLFFVEKKVEKKEEKPVPAKRRKKEPKPLRCHANLLPDSNTKAASSARPGPSKKTSARVKALEEAGFVSATQKMAKVHRQSAQKSNIDRRRNRKPKKVASFDLWGDNDILVTDPKEDAHYADVTKLKRVSRKSRLQEKPSGVPAVELIHPGGSYNPAYDDHQELLQIAHQVETKKVKAENKLENQFRHFPTADKAPNEATWVEEMSAGLFDDNDEVPESTMPLSVNPPVRREDKKTLQQKRKDKERKLEAKQRQEEKGKNVKDNEFFRLKTIKKEITKQEVEFKDRVSKKQALKEKYANKPKKLGKLKFEDVDMPVKLSDELQGSLRLLKPEGNLVEDRFKSLQKRNIIETRLRAKFVRKYKPKKFEKKTHREVRKGIIWLAMGNNWLEPAIIVELTRSHSCTKHLEHSFAVTTATDQEY